MSVDHKPSVQFFIEDIEFDLSQEEKIISWILKVIKNEKANVSLLNYILSSDEYVLEINKEYLGHNYFTDIITFPLSETPIESDIFISIDRVKENAETYNKSFEDELLRVIIHGLLHLIGYNDKSEDGQKEMRQKEDSCIALF